MSILNPKTKFVISSEKKLEQVSIYIESILIGENKFCLEGIFGSKDVFYTGKLEGDKCFLTRNIDTSFSIPVYPTALISIYPKDENSSYVSVECSLSKWWVITFSILYTVLLIVLVFKLTRADSFAELSLLVLKVLGSMLLFNLLIYGYHITEVNNFRKILKDC
jgi:hypothetical protein